MSKAVLITGGSSGIGYQFSRKFAADRYHILWASLLPDELEKAKADLMAEFPSATIDTMAIDLSTDDGAERVKGWVDTNGWQVDVLINNAGFGTFGFLTDIDMERELTMLRLNVLNLYRMTRLFLTDMLARDAGTIINISSTSSLRPVPKFATYASTKAFVSHFSQSIEGELRVLNANVRVMTVVPAAIKNTDFKHTAQMSNVRTFEGLAATTAEEVADDVWRKFKTGQPLVISGAKMRWLYPLFLLVPKRLFRWLLQWELGESTYQSN